MATPCWQKLLYDSYDGRIDHVYPIPCYHQAIAHLPIVVSVYSSTRDDILRALQRRLETTQNVIVGPHAAGGTGSLPIPLLVLGSLAVVLMASGAAGLIWRRLQSRRG